MLLHGKPLCPWVHNAGSHQRPRAWSIRQRRLSHWLLVANLQGNEVLRIGDTLLPIPPGTVYYVAPGELADLGASGPSRPAWVHLDLVFHPRRDHHPQVGAYASSLADRRSWLQPDAQAVFGAPLPRLAPPDLAQAIVAELPALIAAWQGGALIDRHLLASRCWQWLLQWARSSPAPSPAADPLLQVAAWAKAQLAIADVASMAQRAGCARSLLSTRWQQRFGLSPGRWLRHERLSEAARLLQHPDLSLDEIAHCCGWADATAFIRSWKAAHGRTPRQAGNNQVQSFFPPAAPKLRW